MRRLLLFDIDGTLVSGGPAKVAFTEALMETFGTVGPIEVHEFSGKTDPQIARELLEKAGLEKGEIDEGLPRLFERYLAGLEERLPQDPMKVLPGVPELVEALRRIDDVALGLLTGNVTGGARLKLSASGLFPHFRMGAYGSDAEERNELPAVALSRAEKEWGVRFPGQDVLIIGDTPRDVECGLVHNLTTVAVATGNYPAEALHEAGAHHILPDFTDRDAVVELLAG
jgi:phosphoglycolate phosphatase-like HAD superfamily hydrolase